MSKIIGALAALLLVFAIACGNESGVSGEGECGEDAACAPRNSESVPDAMGMQLETACPVLSEAGYVGGVRTVVDDSDQEPGTVLGMKPEAGTKAYESQVIMMQVAGPVSIDRLPLGCVTRVPGTF